MIVFIMINLIDLYYWEDYMYRKTKLYLLFIFLFVFAFLTLGYALIVGIDLNVGGTVTAKLTGEPIVDTYSVRFDQIEQYSGSTNDIAFSNMAITGEDQNEATFSVSGMKGYGDVATIKYSIVNDSTIANANFTINTTNSNSEFFSVTSNLYDATLTNNVTTLAPGATAHLVIKIKSIKVSTDANKSTDIGVSIRAVKSS